MRAISTERSMLFPKTLSPPRALGGLVGARHSAPFLMSVSGEAGDSATSLLEPVTSMESGLLVALGDEEEEDDDFFLDDDDDDDDLDDDDDEEEEVEKEEEEEEEEFGEEPAEEEEEVKKEDDDLLEEDDAEVAEPGADEEE